MARIKLEPSPAVIGLESKRVSEKEKREGKKDRGVKVGGGERKQSLTG